MDMNNRLIYNPEEIVRLIENEIEKLRIYQYDNKYRNLLGEDFTSRIGKWGKDILARKDDPFTIVVCGEFKKGKSSLVNALLAENVVPSNVTPETVTLNRISYGSHTNEAVLSSGKRLLISDEEMERERLELLMKEAGYKFQQIEIKRPLDFLKKAVIIDTPGVGDSMQDFSTMVEAALVQADAVIYVFSVGYPLSQTEQLFLKTMILPQKYTELMLVGNCLDLLKSEEDYVRMEQFLKKRIELLLPDQKVYMLSALDERSRQIGNGRPNPDMAEALASRFDAFRERIDSLVSEKKENVIPDRMQRMTRGMLYELGLHLDAMEKGLEMSEQEAAEIALEAKEAKSHKLQQQEEAKQLILQEIQQMKVQAKAWMTNLLMRMQEEIQNLQDISYEDLMKYYTFYCLDTIKDALDRCVETHVLALYDRVDEISADLSTKFSKATVNPAYSFQFALDNRSWTMGDNVAYVLSHIPYLNLFVGTAADIIAGTMRENEIEQKAPNVLKAISSQYQNLQSSVEETIESVYNKIAENLAKQIDAFYQEQNQAEDELLKQTERTARQDQDRKQEIRNVILEVRGILAEINDEMGEITA